MVAVATFECGMCGAKRKEEGDRLPDGWRLPARRIELGGRAQDRLPRHLVLGLCSKRCLDQAQTAEKERVASFLRDRFS